MYEPAYPHLDLHRCTQTKKSMLARWELQPGQLAHPESSSWVPLQITSWHLKWSPGCFLQCMSMSEFVTTTASRQLFWKKNVRVHQRWTPPKRKYLSPNMPNTPRGTSTLICLKNVRIPSSFSDRSPLVGAFGVTRAARQSKMRGWLIGS